MNALEMFAGLDWWAIAGWTMLHYLWFGLVVGAVAAVLRFVLRRASAQVRYATAVVCLAALAVLPVGVGIGVGGRVSGVRESVGIDSEDVSAKPQAVVGARRGGAVAPVVGDGDLAKPQAASETVDKDIAAEIARGVAPVMVHVEPIAARSLSDWSAFVEIAARWLPWVWIVGAPVTFLLLCTGVLGAERLRRESRLVNDGPVVECLERLRGSLSIGRRVAVAVCERVAAPVLVGVVRPLILLPPSALSGWSPDEIEMVLLHELAHVRRWDNLVNLVQRFVEAALFFQPAVWLVSGWVRREREACCDAVVVGATQRPREYAELLVEMAARMFEAGEAGQDRPRLSIFTRGRGRPGSLVSAMAAGPLRGRIRRILGIHDDPMLVSGKSLGVVMSGLLLAATLVVLNLPTRSEAEQKAELTTEGTESTEGKTEKTDLFDVGVPDTAAVFVVSADNPEETRSYTLPLMNRDALLANFKWLQSGGMGIDMPFTYRASKEHGNAVDIVAAKAAHERFFAGYIKLFEEGLIAPVNTDNANSSKAGTASALTTEGTESTESPKTKPAVAANAASKFPTLEEQKLADLIWKRLNGLELEPLTAEQQKKVQEFGYAGGLRNSTNNASGLQQGDILVGLHVWPTKSLQDVVNVINRDDIAELSPLKYYVVREGQFGGAFVDTGRIEVTEIIRAAPTSRARASDSQRRSGNAYEPIPIPPLTKAEKAKLHERGPVRLQFYFAPNSEPCQRGEERLVEIQKAFGDLVQIERINVVEQVALPARQHVGVIPTMVLYLGDMEVSRLSGAYTVSGLETRLAKLAREADSAKAPAPSLPPVDPQPATGYSAPTPISPPLTSLAPQPAAGLPVPSMPNAVARREERHNAPVVTRIVPRLTPDNTVVYEAVPITDQGTTYPVVPPSSATAAPALPVYKPHPVEPVQVPVVAPSAYPPATEEEINAVREYGTIRIELYLDPNSKAGREAVAMIPKYEAALPKLVKIEQRDVAKDPKLAEEAGIGKTLPAYKLFYKMANGEVGLQTSVGELSVEDLKNAVARVARQELWRGPVAREAAAVGDDASGEAPEIPEDVRQALTERGPLMLEVFYAEDSLQSRVQRSVVRDFVRTYPAVPLDIEMKNVEVHRSEAVRRNITRVPTLVWLHDGKVVRESAGPSSFVEIRNQLFAVARALPEKTAEAQAPKPTLRYDGKTFDQWRTEWQTELSTAKRIEAVKALAAFGANGQGAEAAVEIVALAGQYPWDVRIGDSNDSVDKLREACLAAFGHQQVSGLTQRIPDAEAAPVIVEAARSKQRDERMFAICILSGLARTNEGAAEALVKLTYDPDALVRNRAIECLASIGSTADAKITGRLQEILSSDDAEAAALALANLRNAESLDVDWLHFLLHRKDEVRWQALRSLAAMRQNNPEQFDELPQIEKLRQQLLGIWDDASRAADHAAAIRGLAQVSYGDEEMHVRLDTLMMNRDAPMPLRVAAMQALTQITGNGSIENRLRSDFIEAHKVQQRTPEFRAAFNHLEKMIHAESRAQP